MADPENPPPELPAERPAERPKLEAIDARLVRRLADILKDTDLTEIEVERGDLKIRVSRGSPATVPVFPTSFTHLAAAPAAPSAAIVAAAQESAQAAALAASDPDAKPERRGDTINSPMVGTVYMSPQPGAPAFVKPGDKVTEGQTLLIIEAMKTMNPIPARRAGVVAELLVQDGQPVEYGEPLIVLE